MVVVEIVVKCEVVKVEVKHDPVALWKVPAAVRPCEVVEVEVEVVQVQARHAEVVRELNEVDVVLAHVLPDG